MKSKRVSLTINTQPMDTICSTTDIQNKRLTPTITNMINHTNETSKSIRQAKFTTTLSTKSNDHKPFYSSYLKNQENKGLRNENKFNNFIQKLQKTREKSRQILGNNIETIQTLMLTENKPNINEGLKDNLKHHEEYYQHDTSGDSNNNNNNNNNNNTNNNHFSPNINTNHSNNMISNTSNAGKSLFNDEKNKRYLSMNQEPKFEDKFSHDVEKKTQAKTMEHIKGILTHLKHDKKHEKNVVKYLTKVPMIETQSLQKPKFLTTEVGPGSMKNDLYDRVLKNPYNNNNNQQEDRESLSMNKALKVMKTFQFDKTNQKFLNKEALSFTDKLALVRSVTDNLSLLKNNTNNNTNSTAIKPLINQISNTNPIDHSNQSEQFLLNLSPNSPPGITEKMIKSSRRLTIQRRKKQDLDIDELLDIVDLTRVNQNIMSSHHSGDFSRSFHNEQDFVLEKNSPKMETIKIKDKIYHNIHSLNKKGKLALPMERKDSLNEDFFQTQVNIKKLKDSAVQEDSYQQIEDSVTDQFVKHLRKQNDQRDLFNRYCVKVKSQVSPKKAQEKAIELEIQHFRSRANALLDEGNPNLKSNQRYINNKKFLINNYEKLRKKCVREAKSTRNAANVVEKKFSQMNESLQLLIGDFSEFDEYLIAALRKDMLKEKQNLPGMDMTAKVLNENTKPAKKSRPFTAKS